MTAIPLDSASVILVRSDEDGQRALLVRRGTSLVFAGGTLVFPGGKLEAADGSAKALGLLRFQPPAALAMLEVLGLPLALAVAACREAFEETGIVLARRADGVLCDASLAQRLQPHRARVLEDPSFFPALLADHELIIDLADLMPWAHWITPSLLPKRFDTLFFLASMPPGQEPNCNQTEATETVWLNLAAGTPLPDERLLLATPTRYALGDLTLSLSKHGTLGRLMQLEETRQIAPITPKIVNIDGKAWTVLPWDPEYLASPGEGVAPPDAWVSPYYRGFPSRTASTMKLPRCP